MSPGEGISRFFPDDPWRSEELYQKQQRLLRTLHQFQYWKASDLRSLYVRKYKDKLHRSHSVRSHPAAEEQYIPWHLQDIQ